MLKSLKKNIFLKLYHYYLNKLLSKVWLVFLYFLLISFLIFVQLFSRSSETKPPFSGVDITWQQKLVFFWFISFIQLFVSLYMMIPFVSYLVGRGLGWEELKKKQFFQIPKISRKEDIKVLIFTPNVNRETVIWAKFAAAFTYFMGINFFLTLFGLIYFLFVAKFGIISSCLFLLLNGLGLALVNFLLLIPFLFYQQESGSVLASILLSFFIFFLIFSLFLLRSFVLQYPIIFMIASVPFAILVGYFFFSCYWKSFLSKDLE